MKHTTIKIWVETRRRLKILAALRGKAMVQILAELVDEALEDAGYKEPQNPASDN